MKLTKRHYDVFRNECLRLWKLWKFDGWQLNIGRGKLSEGAAAHEIANISQRRITITFTNSWPYDALPSRGDLIGYARHEMVHALLEPLATLGECRYVTNDEVDAGNHEVLRRLMRILFED